MRSTWREMKLGFEASGQDVDSLQGGVRASAFNPTDFALVDARFLGKLALSQPQSLAALNELTRDLEVSSKRLGLCDRGRAIPARLLVQLPHEVAESTAWKSLSHDTTDYGLQPISRQGALR